jgi:hypothetical protein
MLRFSEAFGFRLSIGRIPAAISHSQNGTGRVAKPFVLRRNSVTPRFALEGAALFAFFLPAKGAGLDPTHTKYFLVGTA